MLRIPHSNSFLPSLMLDTPDNRRNLIAVIGAMTVVNLVFLLYLPFPVWRPYQNTVRRASA